MTVLLPEDQLLEYVRGQRWFGAKSQDLVGASLVDHAVLRTDPQLVDALVELRYAPGTHDLYQLLLGADGTDMIAHPAAGSELVRLVGRSATVATVDGQIGFERFGDDPLELQVDRSRPLRAEQSNSSLAVDDRYFVKLYRRIEAGENPELEVARFLAAHGFENAPALHGWWSYGGPLLGGTLGIVQDFVPGAVDGWTLALDELDGRPNDFVARVHRLGEVIGQLHATLASDPGDPAFAAEEVTGESFALLAASMDDDITTVFQRLPEGDEAVAPIVGYGEAVRDLLRSLAAIGSLARRIRNHGDLHLGQVLWMGSDWLVIDFEGEPSRSVPERRTKRSPLRDVAGMLRSFTYAATAARVPQDVEQRAREAFLDAYTTAVQGTGLLPSAEVTERLLRLFELEKAVYELGYELAHRPEWVPIPVAGILRLLEEASP
jgi:trehalose synthase-fused probable maltokinase